jgi:hypothetical protein
MQSANYERSVRKTENPADAATHKTVMFYSHKNGKRGAAKITTDRARTRLGKARKGMAEGIG